MKWNLNCTLSLNFDEFISELKNKGIDSDGFKNQVVLSTANKDLVRRFYSIKKNLENAMSLTIIKVYDEEIDKIYSCIGPKSSIESSIYDEKIAITTETKDAESSPYDYHFSDNNPLHHADGENGYSNLLSVL